MSATSSGKFHYLPNLTLKRINEEQMGETPVIDEVLANASVCPSHKQSGKLVRFVFASDLHNNYRVWAEKCMDLTASLRMSNAVSYLPSGDIFVITGDWTEAGGPEEVNLFLRFLTKCVKAKKFKHIVCIAGNH